MKSALPRRLRRSESFLGIHFDFHAGDDCKQIGKNVTRAMIAQIVTQVRPDYVQCDCKGHRGLSSYPTKAGHPAPGFVRDPLRIWREVTAKHGVALYLHYSGVWDNEACKRHPDWARIDEKGKRDDKITSVFGPYADKLLISQLKELCDDYGVDGVWVDGECWATLPDYAPHVIQAFREATGIRNIPRKPDDPHYYEFLEFCREGFRRYLRHYVDEMHRHNPGFQIASNWAYSSFMPEPVKIGVDFISGDYSMQDSVNAARLEGRCMARQGRPWDLMAWSFSGKWEDHCRSTKTIPQLQREAAIVLALGGGFQAYITQKRDGSVRLWTMKLMAEVAKFCRARQRFCHRAEAVPQIALLNSGPAYYRKSKNLLRPWGGELVPLSGVLNALLDAQNPVEILSEHHLTGRMREYPLIVVPESEYLVSSFRSKLLDYVRSGGSLLLIGPRCAAMFKGELGVRFAGKPTAKQQWLEHNGWLGGIGSGSQPVKLSGGAAAFGRLYDEDDDAGPWHIAASIRKLGRGRIAATYFSFGERYRKASTAVARDFLNAMVRELFPKPIVEVRGSHCVDVSANRMNGTLSINLVNTAGPHTDKEVYAFDEIPPVGPLSITIRPGFTPRKITVQPAGRAAPFTARRGQVLLTLPRLEIHDILCVE
ncbi:MAG: hypothetical protein NTW87_27650 [Planctomycetota bacterium]|nr:hypothetical protein [Planctomycetota bacterium]